MVVMWDFKEALMDTIKDKYESQYVKVIEVNGANLEMKNYWLARREKRIKEADSLWNEVYIRGKILTRYGKKRT